jgi:glucokinase
MSMPDSALLTRTDEGVIALDIGGTSIKSAVVIRGGQILGTLNVTSIDSSGDAESILSTIAHVIEEHLKQITPARLLGVTIGFPGPFDYQAGICLVQSVGKYGAIYRMNMREILRARLKLEGAAFLFRNDAEAAILGEACYGAGRPYRRLMGVTLGTGCGSAFIENGLPITSVPGVPPDGWVYTLNFHGNRADDVFSRRGLEARLRSVGAAQTNVKEAAEAARAGNLIALRVFKGFGRDLGEFLDPIARAFHAEILLVLGRIAGALDLFGPDLERTLSIPALPGQRGPEAALFGTADLIFKQCQETI